MGFKFNPFTGKLDITVTRIANSTQSGLLSASDWNTFNNKLDPSRFNYITNPDAEVDTSDWNLYNDFGRTNPAYVVEQDLTFTAVASGDTGNGINVDYIFHATQSYLTPLVTVVSPTHITVAWYNGPSIANNPTATQLKAAWDAVPGAVAIATVAITGTASHLQYISGSHLLGNGGDASPVDGTGGVVTGVTFTRSTVSPIVGDASFILSKDAANREGTGVSTDFTINNLDKSSVLQVSFAYSGSSGMVLGTSSDARVFIYDISNAALIPLTPLATLAGPVSTIKTFTGQFTSSTSSNYRLIIHISTQSATAWDLQLDNFILSSILSPTDATEVPSLVLLNQPISGSVTDRMCVMWRDSATQWVPATIAGAAIPVFGTDITQLGFATNIVGSTADIYIRGKMDGFSFGPFTGYDQYLDNTAGAISPLPSPFTDTYVRVGKGISSTVLNIQFDIHVDLISNSSGTPLKGGLLSNSAVNDGTGDQVLSVGSNGNVLVAASGQTLGLQWAAAIVNGGGFTYTVATRTLAAALAGDVTGSITTTAIAATVVTGKLITGYVSGAGTVAATDTILQAINKLNGNNLLKANIASPTFTGVPAAPTAGAGTNTTQIATTAFVTTADNLKANLASPTFTGTPAAPTAGAGTNTTQIATTAFVTTADNLKAPLASPTFTGDVNSSTGNILISTIGKGLQVKTGTNAKIGTAVLVAGTVTVANTSVTANSRIFLTSQVDGGTVGFLRITAITNATSFVITSSSILDTSTVAWMIVESIP